MGTCMGHCVLARVHLTLVWYATSPLGAARGGNPRVNVSLCVRPVHHACTRACALQVTLDHAACLALCASCANCRFASVSRAHRQHGQTFPRSRPASYAPCGHTAHHPRGPTACSGALRSSRGPSCPCCPGPRRQPSGRGRRRVLYLETAAAFRPCPRSLNLRCLCLSRHPDHCAWFEECDASALWLGPIDVGDGFMYTTYEVWGRAETV